MLAVKGYQVVLLPAFLGSAGTLYKCLERATQEMDIPNAREKKLQENFDKRDKKKHR
jgi:hypothetical protein